MRTRARRNAVIAGVILGLSAPVGQADLTDTCFLDSSYIVSGYMTDGYLNETCGGDPGDPGNGQRHPRGINSFGLSIGP